MEEEKPQLMNKKNSLLQERKFWNVLVEKMQKKMMSANRS